jgi:hypothetical protein
MKPWAVWLLRILVLVETVLLLNQAVYAGQFLGGDFAALVRHARNADAAGTVALLQVIAAVLLRRSGGGPAWPIWACAGLLVGIAGQIGLGYANVLTLHVPLGVAVTAGTGGLAIWAWLPKPSVERIEVPG